MEIDDESLNEPERDPDQRPQQESEDGSPVFESSVISRDSTLPNVDVQDVIRDGNAPVHQLERVCEIPVSLFSDREAEQLAFTFLFPDGINGYCTARDPSTFITFSADDMNWPDLLAILAKQAGMEVTEETIAQLSSEQKRVVVQQPCHYCSALPRSLPKLCQAHPQGLWKTKSVEGLCAAPDFIDQYITTRVPSEDSGDDELC